jgi:hypothetical protein
MQMKLSIRKSLVGLLVAGVASCTASINPPPGGAGSGAGTGTGTGSGTGTGTGNSTGTGTGSGTGSGTGTGTGGSSVVAPGTGGGGTVIGGTGGSGVGTGTAGTTGTIACSPGVPATSQVPRMTIKQYETVVKDLLGVTTLTGSVLPGSLLAPDSAGSLTDIAWNGYLSAAEKIAGEVIAGANKTKFISCDPTAGTCLADTIKAFGRKAFRRPLTTAEQTSFMRFNTLTPKGTAAEISEAVLYAFLASPSFLTLPELAQDKEGTSLKLTSYEVATRLSFLFWNSIPDDALNTAADAGQLTTKDQIVAQAKRLMLSPKAAGVASTFHQFYADINPGTHWYNTTTHTASKFPNFTAASYTAAMAEMDAFFQDIVVNGGKFGDLFTSTSGFVTKDTAPLYGITSTATTPTKVALDAAKRPGFLTRIGFLSTFSHEDSSSPILRGAFINNRVLGIPTGTPDPSFLGVKPPAGTYTTNRQATEALTNVAPCNTCHTAKVNPPGFVLERFNAVGTWQDKDALGGDINSTADVMLSANPLTTKTLTTPAELMAEIGKIPTAQRMYAQQWMVYATGRSPNANDACTVDTLAGNMANATYTIASMMADYTQADSFRLRALGN